MTIALIDGDILLYRIGYTTENDPEEIAQIRVDDLIDSILMETRAKEFEVWLSDNRHNNFRYALSPEYKANRTQPRPKHYEIIKEHLVKEWGARIAFGMEADDALGIAQDKGFGMRVGMHGPKTVICSIDKDLLQIPGSHWNFVRKEACTVGKWEGIKWFYQQLLIGDNSDNIRGCKGIGPVKAFKAIDPIGSTEGEIRLFETVVSVYERQEVEASKQEILDHILLAGRLLKIRQSEDEELWQFPKKNTIDSTGSEIEKESMLGNASGGLKTENSLKYLQKHKEEKWNFPKPSPTATSISLSTPSTQEAPIQSTEPTTQVTSTVGFVLLGEQTASTSKESPPSSTLQGR